MKALRFFFILLLLSSPFSACRQSSDSQNLPTVEAAPPTSAVSKNSAAHIAYEIEVETAEARLTTAKVRCTGMVGAAREACIADAEYQYAARLKVAEIRRDAATALPPRLLTQAYLQ